MPNEENAQTGNTLRLPVAQVGVSAPDPGVTVHRIPPSDHPIYQAVGRVAAAWSRLERELDLVIAGLLERDPKRSACVTSQILGAGYRIDAIQLLAETLNIPETITGNLAEFKGKCLGTQKKRNIIVHDPWYFEVLSESIAQFKSMDREERKYGFFEISSTEIDKTLDEIELRFTFVFQLRGRILNANILK